MSARRSPNVSGSPYPEAMFPLAAAAASSGPRTSGVAVVLGVAAALIIAILLTEAIAAVLRAVGRRRWVWAHLSRRARLPLLATLVVLAVWVAVGITTHGTPPTFDRVAAAAAVLALTWLFAAALPACVDAALGRHRLDEPGHRHARGSRAQAAALRAAVRGVVLIGGLAGLLLVLPATRVAGLVVVGLLVLVLAALVGAAVPWLRDVAAGLELAATDGLRLDDVVSVDGVWGRVEEVTATSVVVQAWDDRRLVVPARRFTTEPFENWTRRSADLVGTVEVDLAPGVPVVAVRAELLRVLEANDLWDRRVAVLQVTDATGGRVRVRAAVSAADAPRLADLQCDVREALVEWLAREYPARPGVVAEVAIARARHTAEPGAPAAGADSRRSHEPGGTTSVVDPRRDSRLFTGSVFAVERSRAFTGPGAEVVAERDATAGP